jgi:Fe-S-cluster containining protein
MGTVISIAEPMGEYRFRITYSTTGEEREVILDPDKRDLYFFQSPPDTMSCPFLRENSSKKICTVHGSRPELCRGYGCFRILILSAEGERVGRVVNGTRILTSMDPELNRIWRERCCLPEIQDEMRWEETIGLLLSDAGYRVVR